MLYSMSRISTSSAKPAADMNHAAVASADIASWNEAAQLATAGTSAPTNMALVIFLVLVVLVVFRVVVPPAVFVEGGANRSGGSRAAARRHARARAVRPGVRDASGALSVRMTLACLSIDVHPRDAFAQKVKREKYRTDTFARKISQTD